MKADQSSYFPRSNFTRIVFCSLWSFPKLKFSTDVLHAEQMLNARPVAKTMMVEHTKINFLKTFAIPENLVFSFTSGLWYLIFSTYLFGFLYENTILLFQRKFFFFYTIYSKVSCCVMAWPPSFHLNQINLILCLYFILFFFLRKIKTTRL